MTAYFIRKSMRVRFGIARTERRLNDDVMKEPSTPQASYEGSLKELAADHVGLVSSILSVFILPLPVYAVAMVMKSYGWFPQLMGVPVVLWIFIAACIVCYASVVYHCVRLTRLLFPFMWFTLSGAAVVPITTIPLAVLLWACAIRQLRARGLQVGIFGVNPAKVES